MRALERTQALQEGGSLCIHIPLHAGDCPQASLLLVFVCGFNYHSRGICPMSVLRRCMRWNL